MRRAFWACFVFVMACPRNKPTPGPVVVDAGVTVVDAGEVEAERQEALNQMVESTGSGRAAIESEPLGPHDPTDWRAHLKAPIPGGRVEVGTRQEAAGETAADDQFFTGSDDLVRLVRKGRDVSCPLPVSASCAGAPAVEVKGAFTLVCLPQAIIHDGCVSSAFSIDWSRTCLLFDDATCRRMPFVATRFVSPTRLEVDETFSGLPRMPTALADVVGGTKLGCDRKGCKHCPPSRLIRLELDLVDGGMDLHRVVGELTCSEQSCDRQTNAQLHPVGLGCHR